MNSIITIGREYGSGGREIGMKIAEQFSFLFLIKKLLLKRQNETVSIGNCLRALMKKHYPVLYI